MAKDRFSKFKKSNYDTTFRYGNNSILQLIKGCNTEYNKKFLRSIIVENKVPTLKQKEVIKKIIKFIQ